MMVSMRAQSKEIREIDWGAATIGGPRHHFRESFMVDLLTRHLPPPARVLDAGCGSGTLTMRLLSREYRVCSFDLSRRFVERLRRMIPPAAAARSRLLSGSAEQVALRDGVVDGVVCGEVLEHLDHHREAVAEYHRVLRPGGFCLVTVPANRRLWDENDVWAGHRRRYDRGELEQLFTAAGFEVVLVRWWGFPIMRFYHRWIYMPWARRAMNRPTGEAHDGLVARVGKSGFVSRLLGGFFRLERIFSRVPLGIGTLLLARKPPA